MCIYVILFPEQTVPILPSTSLIHVCLYIAFFLNKLLPTTNSCCAHISSNFCHFNFFLALQTVQLSSQSLHFPLYCLNHQTQPQTHFYQNSRHTNFAHSSNLLSLTHTVNLCQGINLVLKLGVPVRMLLFNKLWNDGRYSVQFSIYFRLDVSPSYMIKLHLSKLISYSVKEKGKVFYCQEPPSGESTTT